MIAKKLKNGNIPNMVDYCVNKELQFLREKIEKWEINTKHAKIEKDITPKEAFKVGFKMCQFNVLKLIKEMIT